MSGGRLADMPLAWERPWVFLVETEDERLLCSAPEGLVWLKRKGKGQFKVSEEIPLHVGGYAFSYVGQDAGHLYLTLSDACGRLTRRSSNGKAARAECNVLIAGLGLSADGAPQPVRSGERFWADHAPVFGQPLRCLWVSRF